jgi:hypothetical protein
MTLCNHKLLARASQCPRFVGELAFESAQERPRLVELLFERDDLSAKVTDLALDGVDS